MTFLLDVSLLIALLDENHVHHEMAFHWFERQGNNRWATCPITENGLLRILTAPGYPIPLGPASWVFEIFREFCSRGDHDFWADDFSLLEVASTGSLPSAHLTDLYLLGLAIRKGGKLATLDRRLPAHLLDEGMTSLHVIS